MVHVVTIHRTIEGLFLGATLTDLKGNKVELVQLPPVYNGAIDSKDHQVSEFEGSLLLHHSFIVKKVLAYLSFMLN